MNDNNEIKVSILTVTFNHAQYIRQTLEGYLTQKTGYQYEILIHDDASTDGTQEIIREYMERYPDKIRAILQTENQYSKGISIYDFLRPLMRGKYVAYCEGDDYWCDETKLQRQVEIMEQNPDYVACVHQTIQHNCNTGEDRMVSNIEENRPLTFTDVLKGGNQAYQMSSLLIRTDIFNDTAHFPDFMRVSKICDDYPFSLYFTLLGTVYYINRPMSVYRYQSSENAWTSRRNQLELSLQHYAEMIKMLQMVDEYSENRYHDEIQKKILQYEYITAREKGDKQAVFSPKFKSMYQAESPSMKRKMFIKAIMPMALVQAIQKTKFGRNK